MGGSYGGYATLVGMTFTPDVFACGVDIVGPSNIFTLLNSIPPYWQPMVQMFKDRVGRLQHRGGTRVPDRTLAALARGIDRAAATDRPGQQRSARKANRGRSDRYEMKEKNIPVTYVLYPDEGHGFARPENRLSFNAVMEAFLAKYLGGRFEPIGDAFKGSSITVPDGAEDVPGLPEALEKLQQGA